MPNNPFITLLFIYTLTLSMAADGQTDKAIERLPPNLHDLQLKKVGTTQFSVLFWDIYNSSLYTESGSYSRKTPPDRLIFEIEYLKDITVDDLLERTIQQWEHLEFTEAEYGRFIVPLKTIWPNISSGDKLVLFVNNNQSTFYFNNEKIGLIQQKEFSQIFLDIWLSPKTSQPQLRYELLGK